MQNPLHSLTETDANEEGYKYHNGSKMSLHKSIEDVVWSGSSSGGARVFILADGHGGPGAAIFFVENIRDRVMHLLQWKDWDLENSKDRTLFQENLKNIFIETDNHYTILKFNQFSDWVPNDSNEKKPDDDGCTFVLNILMNGFLINANVGDSRTILAMKTGKLWEIEFSSIDHNTTNPQKIHEITDNGGNFISHKGIVFKISKDDSDYAYLLGARLYRPPSLGSISIGLSHRRTLNLTGSMGDIHFKLDPPVLSGVPDISILQLDESKEYTLIIGSDGVWDHLKINNYDAQNLMVKDHVFSIIDSQDALEKSAPPTPSTFNSDCKDLELIDRLEYVAQTLVQRENTTTSQDLFYGRLLRYDDATVQLVHMAPSDDAWD